MEIAMVEVKLRRDRSWLVLVAIEPGSRRAEFLVRRAIGPEHRAAYFELSHGDARLREPFERYLALGETLRELAPAEVAALRSRL